jgi:hypothetical protein
MSMKNSTDTIGNRTRDLSACAAVPKSSTTLKYKRWTKPEERKSLEQVTKYRQNPEELKCFARLWDL